MKLYENILINLLNDISNPINIEKIFHDKCYITLEKIRDIILDDSLTDPECFEKIEQIVLLFEEIGSNGGNRHDFS